jgi:uncharacterized protein YjiS (DUF1127 family)
MISTAAMKVRCFFWHLLSRAVERVPLMLACSYRTAQLRRSHTLARIDADLFRHERRTRFELAALSQHDVQVLVAQRSRRSGDVAPGTQDSRQSRRATRFSFWSSPLICATIAGRSASTRPSGHSTKIGWRCRRASVRFLRLRLDSISLPCRSVLEWAAVLGARFDLEVAPRRERIGRGKKSMRRSTRLTRPSCSTQCPMSSGAVAFAMG